MLEKKWPEDIYFNGITVILQDRNWFPTPYIADVIFLIKIKKFKIIICTSFFNEPTVSREKIKMDMKRQEKNR
jgi:hypothetical protein